MTDQSKTKIVGAFIIGFAIVAGAFTLKNFGKPSTPPPNLQVAGVAEAPVRVVIDVSDSDKNGIEDWQDQFVKSTSITIKPEATEEYEPPNTLTGQVGVSLFEDIIRAKGYGPVGRSQEQIVTDTVDQINPYASDTIIDVRQIITSQDSSPQAIRTYANAHADAILNNNVPGLKNELLILNDILSEQNSEKIESLDKIKQIYLGTRNDVLKLPVPSILVKEHLDLINVYNALYHDVDAMTNSLNDPMLSLVRLKRYEEDADGLALAFRNIFEAIEPYAATFERNDSALLFVDLIPTGI